MDLSVFTELLVYHSRSVMVPRTRQFCLPLQNAANLFCDNCTQKKCITSSDKLTQTIRDLKSAAKSWLTLIWRVTRVTDNNNALHSESFKGFPKCLCTSELALFLKNSDEGVKMVSDPGSCLTTAQSIHCHEVKFIRYQPDTTRRQGSKRCQRAWAHLLISESPQ